MMTVMIYWLKAWSAIVVDWMSCNLKAGSPSKCHWLATIANQQCYNSKNYNITCAEFWLIYSFSLGILIVLYWVRYIFPIIGSRYHVLLTIEFLTLVETIDVWYWVQLLFHLDAAQDLWWISFFVLVMVTLMWNIGSWIIVDIELSFVNY